MEGSFKKKKILIDFQLLKITDNNVGNNNIIMASIDFIDVV
jgi:hypothetical protein